jgi:hypothetical protein
MSPVGVRDLQKLTGRTAVGEDLTMKNAMARLRALLLAVLWLPVVASAQCGRRGLIRFRFPRRISWPSPRFPFVEVRHGIFTDSSLLFLPLGG